jgi:alginate O-acetyltransferase complex protein AlgI
MLFNSFIFIIFLVILIPAYYFLTPRLRKHLLLVVSYAFYGYWDFRFCSLLFFISVVDFFLGRYIYLSNNNKRKKTLLFVSLVSNFSILGFFKYFNFFSSSLNSFLSVFNIELDYLQLNLILPLGLSFFVFKSLTYTIDVYRGELKFVNSFVDYALFISFFPQLLAGPIERAKNLLPQISIMPTPTKKQFAQGFALLTIGMLKKILVGDTAGKIVDQIFAQPQYFASSELLLGLILFSIQIYADFSGYSSIARGVSKWLGFETMINFNQPYLSSSITEFWRRWHISLSTWFRDYLFLPLAYFATRKITTTKVLGMRSDKVVYSIATLVTFFVCGLWHGASWTFVVWGLLHGIYLVCHRFIMKKKRVNDKYKFNGYLSLFYFAAKVLVTNILVIVTWLFFRSETFGKTAFFIEKMFNWESGDFGIRIFTIGLSFVLVTLIIDFFEYYFKDHEFLLRLRVEYRYGFALVCWVMILLYMVQSAPMPFIYLQF